jgi:hypothetical protein
LGDCLTVSRATSVYAHLDFINAAIVAAHADAGPTFCVGDCNADGQVTVDELIRMTAIALGSQPASACLAGDANHDGTVTVDEEIRAVHNALNGCAPISP